MIKISWYINGKNIKTIKYLKLINLFNLNCYNYYIKIILSKSDVAFEDVKDSANFNIKIVKTPEDNYCTPSNNSCYL